MIRKAFVMSVNADSENEYRDRHNPVWPELEALLLAHGVRNYSIFLHAETRQLFAYVEFADEAQWQAVAQTDTCRRWWNFMRDIMPTNEDHSPKSVYLTEVFHMDDSGNPTEKQFR